MLEKHSITLLGHKTSITIEPEFWSELCKIAARDSLSINKLVSQIDTSELKGNLSSCIRVFVLKSLKNNNN